MTSWANKNKSCIHMGQGSFGMGVSSLHTIKVLIVDDHPLVIEGIARFLLSYTNVAVIGKAYDENSMKQILKTECPDIVLMDINLGGATTGFELMKPLKDKRPDSKVIILTSFDDEEHILQASEMGAYGYLLKSASPETLYDAICAVYAGERWASPEIAGKMMGWVGSVARENTMHTYHLNQTHLAILSHLAEGKTMAEIAELLNYSDRTVKRKLQEIIERFEVNNKTQAVSKAIRLGLIR